MTAVPCNVDGVYAVAHLADGREASLFLDGVQIDCETMTIALRGDDFTGDVVGATVHFGLFHKTVELNATRVDEDHDFVVLQKISLVDDRTRLQTEAAAPDLSPKDGLSGRPGANPDDDASSTEARLSGDPGGPRATPDDDIDASSSVDSAVDDRARLARRLLELATMPFDEDGFPVGETLTESEYWALQELAGDITEIADRWVAQWAASNRARAEGV